MSVRYDTWPETLTCRKCGTEYAAPTRCDMHDSAGPISSLCDPCQAKEDLFRLLHLKRVWRKAHAGRVTA